MAKEKTINYTEKDKAIVSALQVSEAPMTLAEICAATGLDIKAGSITSAIRKGLIVATGEREVFRKGKRKVNAYGIVTSEVLTDEKEKPFPYSEGERAILAAFPADENVTLNQLSEIMGKHLTSGSINALVKKGNIAKSANPVEVEIQTKAHVKEYALGDNADAALA